jgi:hypothetical protein
VAHGGRGLAPCHAALPLEVLSCRRTPRRQGLNTVGHGDKDAAGVPHSGYDGRSIFLKMFGSSIFSKIKKI